MIVLRVKTTYSLVSSVFLSIVDAILKIWCPAWCRVALQEDQSPDAVHLFPLPPRRLSHAALEMLCQIKRQRGPVEMAAGRKESLQQLQAVVMEDAVITSWGSYARCHYYHISYFWAASVSAFKARSDQMASGAALRLRAPSLCARTADALPSTELLLCSIVFKYVGPPQPLLSFPSSCSRLFDNRGKWVLKRQLIASQAPEKAALSGVELRRDWRSWLHYPLIVPPKIRRSMILLIYTTARFPQLFVVYSPLIIKKNNTIIHSPFKQSNGFIIVYIKLKCFNYFENSL